MKHKFSFIELILGIVLIGISLEYGYLEFWTEKLFKDNSYYDSIRSLNIHIWFFVLGITMIISSLKITTIFFKTHIFLRGLTALICDAFFTITFIFETDVLSVIKVIIALMSLPIYYGIASYERSFIPLLLITGALMVLFMVF